MCGDSQKGPVPLQPKDPVMLEAPRKTGWALEAPRFDPGLAQMARRDHQQLQQLAFPFTREAVSALLITFARLI